MTITQEYKIKKIYLLDLFNYSEDIARTCHVHPTFSEAVKEAALSVDKRAIHS